MDKFVDEYLGSGYDVCGKYASAASIKKRIFDLNEVQKNKRMIPNTKSDFFTVSGDSYEQYQTSLTNEVSLKGAYKLFSGSVSSSYSDVELSIEENAFFPSSFSFAI